MSNLVRFPGPPPPGVNIEPCWGPSQEGELIGVYLSERSTDGSLGPTVFLPASELNDLCKLDSVPRVRATPAVRVQRSHEIVEQAARELDTGDRGSGVKALAFAAATYLGLVIGQGDAKAFLEMLSRLAGDVRDDPESAA